MTDTSTSLDGSNDLLVDITAPTFVPERPTGILVFPDAFYQWAKVNSLVWWSAEARWAMGRIAPGEPGWTDTDDDGNPAGDRVMSDTSIDIWDVAIMDVCVAGWRYSLTLPDDQGAAVVAYQRDKDETALTALLEQVEAGYITMTEAEETIRTEIRRQAVALGVDISYVDAVPDEFDPAADLP